MMHIKAFRSVLVLTLLLCALPVKAQDSLGDGVAAYALQDYERAVEIFTRLADDGNAEAQYRLAELYENGFGVAPDMQEAARLFEAAARAGLPRAQYRLGLMYYQGKGVEQDPRTGFDWVLNAAEGGHGRAQHRVGLAYYLEEGVEQDLVSSAFWLSLAAETLGPETGEGTRAASARDIVMGQLGEDEQRELTSRLIEWRNQ